MQKLKITCISENTSFNHSLLASHGQSLLIEIDETNYLVDTTEIYEGLVYNMKRLNIELGDIQNVFLTHSHLDHSGGLFKLAESFTNQKLFLSPDMLSLNEDTDNTSYRHQPKTDEIQNLLDYAHTTIVDDATQLEENIFTTGALKTDINVKEQSIVLNIPNKGLVIVVGCGHPTLPAIVEKAMQVAKTNKIYGIIGGLHYIFSNDGEIAEAVKYIESLNPEFIVPSHCSGYKAIRRMQDVLGEKIHVSATGQFGTGNSVNILPELTFNFR
jgi:7,8-dihydropterin-6-yl-methyl-4-(beta-D-ribofuranosyl)aminobenzene 5'-phosphate synthase